MMVDKIPININDPHVLPACKILPPNSLLRLCPDFADIADSAVGVSYAVLSGNHDGIDQEGIHATTEP